MQRTGCLLPANSLLKAATLQALGPVLIRACALRHSDVHNITAGKHGGVQLCFVARPS